jgi:hypothetical protein
VTIDDDDNDDEQKRTNIHALSEIQTHGLSVQEIKAYKPQTARPLGLARASGLTSSFKCFDTLYCESSKKYKLIFTQFSDP